MLILARHYVSGSKFVRGRLNNLSAMSKLDQAASMSSDPEKCGVISDAARLRQITGNDDDRVAAAQTAHQIFDHPEAM